jgi:hypothetical protein
MAGLAAINIKFRVDLSGFSSEMQTALRQIDKAGQKFQAIGSQLSTFVTLPILAAGGAVIKFASDYNESLNKVDVAFKSSSGEVKNFSKTTLESFGIASGTALDMASNFGDMGTSLGLTTGQASKMSTSLVGLAGDLSSFKNISIDIANTALAGIFTGETESLKKLGIVMTEAALQNYAYSQGIRTKIQDMDQASKVQLRYNYIMAVTKNAQGDFARTSGGAANQMRIFQESLKQVAQQFGAIILPVFTSLITRVNGLITSFGKLSQGTKTTIVVILGIAAAIGPLALAIGGVMSLIPTLVAGFAALSGPLLPIIGGIALIVAGFAAFKAATSDSAKEIVKLSEAQKLNNQVTSAANNSIAGQKAQLESLLLTARNENDSKKNRLEAIKEINRISPQYLGNLNLENINTDKARIAVEKYNAALLSGATARAASKLLEQNQTEKIQQGIEHQKELNKLIERKNLLSKKGLLDQDLKDNIGRQRQAEEAAFAQKNKKYDAEAKQLTDIYAKNQQNLGLLQEENTAIGNIGSKLEKVYKAGTVAFYEQQVEGLQKLQKEQITSNDQWRIYESRIESIKGKIKELQSTKVDLPKPTIDTSVPDVLPAFSLQDLQDQKSYFEKVRSEYSTTSEEYKKYTAAISNTDIKINDITGLQENGAALDLMKLKTEDLAAAQQRLSEVAQTVGSVVGDAFANLAGGLVESMGLASTGFQGFVKGLVGTITKLISMMLASSIAQSISGATASGAATGPAAIFTTPAFIATAVGGVLAAFAAIPKFEIGGIVGGSSYYGDKVLARVNSGELILNQNQQRNLYGQLGGGVSTIIPDVVVKGQDLLLVFDRATNRKNRMGS